MRYELPERLTAQQLSAAAAVFAALAHPVRLRIVSGLLDGRCSVGPMTECLGLPQAYVSRHLSILRKAGVVSSSVEGRQRVYRVSHPAAAALVDLVQQRFPGEGA